ncbi:DNA-processing protein DprA [Sediminibacterium sp.]|uniref:DNA-processing protein DprA n=1 Tax=Sediminibacterium sp. TaxID=1917865 RepID=UPI002724D498|nr:DNA-processing protein DprA [Sediminibacterium sp.]MDO9000555.1 DNA-processing protein DprA [Bacteroidota bacterium]MDP3146877.1 DNA-processing protein DprA [Bacteroidota bacterium]MDP3567577.1 DNA-processing protein DprA [Sediminibacterium sp.]
MNLNELPFQIGLTLIEGIGDVNAKSLLAYCGSASQVFKQKKGQLEKIPGIGSIWAQSIINSKDVLKKAEEEIKFIEKYKITPLFFTDENYPTRLKYCSDSPVLMYYKGNANLNQEKIIGVVGTRKPSDYGKEKTKEFVSELKGTGAIIISGLAYGVDVLAHKTALENELDTVGVVAHGLDRIYPQLHDNIAKRMMGQGGILTDFMSGTNPDAVNFPKRNRIVAGLCDALVVIESKRGGGSLITATIANSYNKDVFAFPGRAGEVLAEGCNGLIKQNRAVLIENAADLLYAMQWQEIESKAKASKQIPLLLNLSDEEKMVIDLFSKKNSLHVDEICHTTEFTISKTSALLLQLEFSNLIKSRPGKMYELA